MGKSQSKIEMIERRNSFDISEAERNIPDEVEYRDHFKRDCAICLNEMKSDCGLKYCRFGCGTPVHLYCVRKWKGTCPTCRDEYFQL